MTKRPCVVLDVNTIVSGSLRGVGAPVDIALHWRRDRIDFVLSEHIVSKVHEIWGRPYFLNRQHGIDRALAESLMREQATMVIPNPSVSGVCDD